jgi:L-ribulose-5-phosphate 4-epimerase
MDVFEDDIGRLRDEMVKVCKSAFGKGLFAGTSGNLSVLLKDKGEMLITPTSVRYESMTGDDIVWMKLDGTILGGKHRPSSEWQMHAVVYEQCPQAGSVFHTHSPYATAFAVIRQTIPLVLIEMRPFLGGELDCARFEKPGTRELGLSAIEVFNRGRTACLLASHGVLTIGGDLAQSYIRAEYVEDAANIYHKALQVGTPVILS